MKFRARLGLAILAVGLLAAIYTPAGYSEGREIVFQSAYAASANPHPKIASELQQAMAFIKTTPKSQRQELFKSLTKGAPSPFRVDPLDRIQCYIKMTDFTKDALNSLKNIGVHVQCTCEERKIAQAWLTLAQINALESLKEVQIIQLPNYPVHNVGSFTTEGYSAMKIDKFINRPEFIGTNLTGKDIKVGVISSAIDRADLSSEQGDLPPVPHDAPKNFFGGITYWSFRTIPGTNQYYGDALRGITTYSFGGEETEDQEGTAMLEIIHDIVPNARLYFSNFDTDIEMNMSKDWLREQGCDVIADDIGFLQVGPFDGTSAVSMGSTKQVENGVAYYVAVGNAGENHWWGYFSDANANNYHNFGPQDETLEIKIPPYGVIILLLSWDEPWGAAGYDIDLYALDPNYLDIGNPLAFSTNPQLGDGDPSERCALINGTPDTQIVSIVITRKARIGGYDDVKHPMRLNLFYLGGTIAETAYQTLEGSILNNCDAGGGVISVGAIDVNSRLQNLVESFSSRGPTWDGRMKPEIVSFDGTRSGIALNGTNFAKFYGTSCAAPHAAGVAALIKGYKISAGDTAFTNPWNKKAIVDNINALIFQGAEDLMPLGVDNTSGYGKINVENVFLRFLKATNRNKRFDFANSKEGWYYYAIPEKFTAGEGIYDNGKLTIKSVDSNTYGTWESPLIVFDPDKKANLNTGKIYIARFNISTSVINPNKFPGFRLRANSKNNTVAAVRDFNANSGNSHFPSSAGKDFFLVINPSDTEIMSGIYLSFDLVNFDATKDPKGDLSLDYVEVIEYNSPMPTP